MATPIYDQLVAELGDPFRAVDQAGTAAAGPVSPVPDPRGEQAAGR